MDFRALYDEKRRLFRIGLLPGESAPAQSWYDLLESEERLTAYFTIASGQIEHRHWRQLSRAQVGYRRRRGMVSWSGSLFEYLMPELFLPLYRGSHLWESARFAVYVQRRRTFGAKKALGHFRSAFYAFDATDHYRYKAHGCAPLALCRDRGDERRLALQQLSCALHRAARGGGKPPAHGGDRTLRPLRAVGGGRFHFLAYRRRAGLRPVRDGAPSRHEPLRDRKRAVRRRAAPVVFQRPGHGRLHGAFCRRRSPPAENSSAACRGAMGRAERAGNAVPRTGEGADPFFPDGAALSNGAYRLLVTANGMSRASCGTLIPYRSARTPWEDAPGIALWAESGGVRQPLLPKPGRRAHCVGASPPGKRSSRDRAGIFFWEMRCTVSRAYPGELRRLRLRSRKAAPDAVIFGFEPVLLDTRDYAAHPAFARLGLCTSVRSGVLIVYRAPRGNQSAQYLALACSGRRVFPPTSGSFPPAAAAGEFRENTGWQNEPYIAARLPLPEGSACEIALALCVAGDADTAARGAQELLRESSGFAMANAAAAIWGMESGESAAAMEYLRALTFPQLCAEGAPCRAGRGTRSGGSAFPAISPSWCSTAGKTARKPRSVSSGGTRCSARAAWSTISCFSPRPPGITGTSSARRSKRRLRQCAFPKRSLPGGVYFAFRGEREALLAAAALFGDAAGTSLPAVRARALRLPPTAEKETGTPPVSHTDTGEVSFQTPPLPPRAWANMLYGGGLGCAAADCGPAALWYENARECPIVPWSGDALAAAGAERLWIETEHGAESLFFGWRRVQRNVRLRLCPLGENYRREPHFGHGVHRARYAGACAPARERRAVQHGVFCTRAACAGERGRGFRVRLARQERPSRGKPALPV